MGESRNETLSQGGAIWASEPFRLFFPLGIAAAVFGLLLWPFFYLGWWPIHPAIQHPRILIFGFGAAFIFGFLGTAWPRFLGAKPLHRTEVASLACLWGMAQFSYSKASIAAGDGFAAASVLFLLLVLGRRFFAGKGRELPPPGFALAFLSLLLGFFVLVCFLLGWDLISPKTDLLVRLFGYQGFLLLPILGVGSYLFPRIIGGDQIPGKRRTFLVWSSAGLVILSFLLEVYLSSRAGNLLRAAAILIWAWGTVPGIFQFRQGGTRRWTLQCGWLLVVLAFLCRAIWPHETFAFEHLLFLGGFSLLMMLVADRVLDTHLEGTAMVEPVSFRWRWFTWLIVLTAATRAVADLVPSTRTSHHIYAAVMLIIVMMVWIARTVRRSSASADEGTVLPEE